MLERCLHLFNAALHLGHKISGGLLMLIGHQGFEHLNASLSSSENLWGKIHICCQEQWSVTSFVVYYLDIDKSFRNEPDNNDLWAGQHV